VYVKTVMIFVNILDCCYFHYTLSFKLLKYFEGNNTFRCLLVCAFYGLWKSLFLVLQVQ